MHISLRQAIGVAFAILALAAGIWFILRPLDKDHDNDLVYTTPESILVINK